MNTTPLSQDHSYLKKFARYAVAAAALTAATFAAAAPASAAKISDLSHGAWSGGAFTNAHTGSFSHCAANAEYKSGVALYFSVTSKQQWSMAFSAEHWAFQPGRTYPVLYQLDNGPVIETTAVAKSRTLVQVQLPINGRVFSRFQTGGVLRVATDQKLMRFTLNGAGTILSKLYKCATAHRPVLDRDHTSPVSEVSFF